MFRLDADEILRVPAFEMFEWLDHGFGTKGSDGQWPDHPSRTATLKQIHSTHVTVGRRSGVLGEGDALVTNQPGLLVAIKTADCIPVLLVDPKNKAVAAIHAGWRGTAGNIVRSAIDTLVSEFHSDPNQLWAAIGPGIGKCCYEVSGNVARQFAPWLPAHATAPDGTLLDLKEANRIQLIEAGLSPAQVLVSGSVEWCTRCHGELFHSYRRDGDTAGRMYAAIGIRGDRIVLR
jgi:YfiH family protein